MSPSSESPARQRPASWRDREEKAQAVVKTVWPQRRQRQELLEALAHSIATANEVTPAGWGVTLFRAPHRLGLRLNVGKVEVFSAFAAAAPRLLVHTGARNPTYKTAPRCLMIALYPEALGWLYAKLKGDHDKAIRIGGQTAKGRSRRYGSERLAFSPGLLHYLRAELKKPIPFPAWTA